MLYLRPSVHSVSHPYIASEAQYTEIVGLVPDGNGCPTVLFSGDTGTGVVNFDASFTFSFKFENGQSCVIETSNISGQATFQNGALLLDCSNLQSSCDEFKCNVIDQNRIGGEVCLDSLTINGEAQNAGICIDVDETDLFSILRQVCEPS